MRCRFSLILIISLLILISCNPAPSGNTSSDSVISSEDIHTEALVEDILSGDEGITVTWEEADSAIAAERGAEHYSLIAHVFFDGYRGKGISDAIEEIVSGAIDLVFDATRQDGIVSLGEFTISTSSELSVSRKDATEPESAIFTGSGSAAGTDISYSSDSSGTVSGIVVKTEINITVEINITINEGTSEKPSDSPALLLADISLREGLEVKKGDIFDASDYTVKLYFDNGYTKEVIGTGIITPYSPVINETPFKVVVRYEGQSILSEIEYDFSIYIPILPKLPESVRISQVMNFTEGDEFDSSAFRINVTYNDGSTRELNGSGIVFIDRDNSGDVTEGDKVSIDVGTDLYGNPVTDEIAIEIVKPVYTVSVDITQIAGFKKGDPFDPDKFQITARYSNGNQAVLSSSILIFNDKDNSGNVTEGDSVSVTVGNDYHGNPAIYETLIYVSDPVVIFPEPPDSVTIEQIGDFAEWDSFDSSKFIVAVEYPSGKTKVLDNSLLIFNDNDNSGNVTEGDTVSIEVGSDQDGNPVADEIRIEVTQTVYTVSAYITQIDGFENGDPFDPDKFQVTTRYSNGNEAILSSPILIFKDNDNSGNVTEGDSVLVTAGSDINGNPVVATGRISIAE